MSYQKIKAVLISCLLMALTGCASEEKLKEKVVSLKDPDLCVAYLLLPASDRRAPVVIEEVNARNVDCMRYMELAKLKLEASRVEALEKAAQGQALKNAGNYINNMNKQNSPQPINCTTTKNGMFVNTTCN